MAPKWTPEPLKKVRKALEDPRGLEDEPMIAPDSPERALKTTSTPKGLWGRADRFSVSHRR
eukprot:5708660-Pyramimonas_sp.AAC.1